VLALIPARGGSKGLPGKNIKMLAGKPLIAWTIEIALASNLIEQVIVSTDDDEIAKIAADFGADIPFMRPDHLATDTALAIDNYLFSIPEYEKHYKTNFNSFIVLQPTSPLRIVEDIDNSIRLFEEKNADSVISFTKASHPPFWAKRISDDGRINDYFENIQAVGNRQEFTDAYMPNGAVYVLKYDLLQKHRTYYSDKTYAFLMPEERSIDIDTPWDFHLAELVMRSRNCEYK
jgi:N-acylneuraminate cytidylyltransferase/CMP-N,N'-diacetyllegionaminic acid synthase